MNNLSNEYLLNFAIQVRRIMGYEKWKGNEHLREHVWKPTQAFLQDFADSSPTQIVCFFGKQFIFPNQVGCACQHIFIVNHHKEVAYLGTIFNKKAVTADRSRMPDKQRKLTQSHPNKVSRDSACYVIPSNEEEIDERVVISSIKKYLLSYKKTSIPSLAITTICLLSKEEGETLDKKIHQEAKRLAKEDL